MQRFLDLFISINCSTCFRRFLRPSSAAQNCTYSVRYRQTNTAAGCYRGWDGNFVPSYTRYVFWFALQLFFLKHFSL